MLAIMSWLVPRDGCVRPNCVAVIHRSWSSDAFDSREFSRKRSGSVYEAREVPRKNLPPLLRHFFNYAHVWWLARAWMAFCTHTNLLASFFPQLLRGTKRTGVRVRVHCLENLDDTFCFDWLLEELKCF